MCGGIKCKKKYVESVPEKPVCGKKKSYGIGGVQEKRKDPEASKGKYPVGENGRMQMHNTGLSTAPRGGNRPGPKQGPSDQDINLQITRPPPTFATKNIMCQLEHLNLGTKRKEVKKWKEIE